MPEIYVVKRVFEVARELKVPTPDLLEFLVIAGHDVTRKQMQPVTEQMFIAILHRFDRLKFEQYLIANGILGEDLRRMVALLDDQWRNVIPQKKKAPAPPKVIEEAPPKPKPIPVLRQPRPQRPRFEPKPTRARRAFMNDESPSFKIILTKRPVNVMAQSSSEPKAIPTTPLALELIHRVLALTNEQKLGLLREMREAA